MVMEKMKVIMAEHENKIVNAVIAIEVTILLWMSIVGYFGSISDFREFVYWKIENVPQTCLVETGITRSEMLVRFGSADSMEIYYDKEKYHSDITKFYYHIDKDYDLFLVFISSWKTDTIIDFYMVRGYRRWYF